MSEPLALAESTLKEGNPSAALTHLTAAVKAKPADVRLRIFMAQLLCVLGQWERAHTQLNVIADLMPSAGPMREMVGHALRCELIRAEVFAGKRAPMVFGQPDEWLALLIESLLQSGQGDTALSHDLARRAFDAAPAVSGQLNGEPFAWIADADSRLGPVLEAFVNGRYYWVPYTRLLRVNFEPPTDLRDKVWMPAYLTFSNGGEVVAMIPTRYPGSQLSSDTQIQMSAKTEWREIGPERFAGLGERVLTTDLADHGLQSVLSITLDNALLDADEPTGADGAGDDTAASAQA